MTGNVFDGDVLFLDWTSPGKTTILDVFLPTMFARAT